MNSKIHSLSLESRTKLNVTAVDEVLSFDEELVALAVGDSVLNISGENLSIKNLSIDCGDVSVTGNITAMVYFANPPSKKRFGLFGGGRK
jgi:sporulation protein YabP